MFYLSNWGGRGSEAFDVHHLNHPSSFFHLFFPPRFLRPFVRVAKIDGFERLGAALLSQNFPLEIEGGKNPIGNVDTSREKKEKKKERKLLVARRRSREDFLDGKTSRRSAGCTSCLSRSSRPGTFASFSSLCLCRNFPRKPRDTDG